MLLLVNTTDKLQLITGSAASVDVHASYADKNQSTGAISEGRQNTAITTAATTDIVAAPAATTTRNVRTLHVRNKHATQATDVTVIYDQNGTDYEMFKCNLAAGEALEYVEGVGFFEVAASPTLATGSANTADQTANAADTYLAGSAFSFVGKLRAGSFFRWVVTATKTAAGVATPIWNVRVGTAGTTADTGRLTFTGLAQTAAIDTGRFAIDVNVRTIGASGVISGTYALVAHRLAATGFCNQAIDCVQATSASFDLTPTGSVIGLSVNPGSAGVWTIKEVNLDAVNLVT